MSSDTQQQVEQLNKQVVQLYEEGQYEQAIGIATQACDLARQHFAEDDPLLAASLNNLAQLYAATGDYTAAEPLYRQALQIRRTALGEQDPAVVMTLNNLARLYVEMGHYAAAEPLYQQALQILRTASGEQDPAFAMTLNNLARLYVFMSRYAEVESLLQRASDILRTTLGQKHPYYTASLNNLASLYSALGNYATAENLYREALSIERQILGDAHPEVATKMNNLAELYRVQGDYSKAEPLLQQALEIRRSVLGEEHPDVAESLSSLAELYRAQGDYSTAEPLYQQTLSIQRVALGEEHPSLAESLNNLAELYIAMGKYAAARPLLERVLASRRVVLAENHPSVAQSMNNLATLNLVMGNYTDAEALLEQTLAIQRAALGEGHPDVATSLNNLAELYVAQGNYVAAEPLSRQAYEIYRAVLGDNHPTVARSLGNLAELDSKMGNVASAISRLEQARSIQRQALGENHPDLAITLNGLAQLYSGMGDVAFAEPLYQQALHIQRTTFGETHPHMVRSLNDLAGLYSGMGDYTAAEALYRQALEIQRTTLGEEHPEVATCLDNLASLHHAMGNYIEAELLYRKVLEMRRTVLEEKHPDVAASLNNLAGLYFGMGNYTAAEPLYLEARTIRRQMLDKEHPDFATTLNNLAKLYVATHREMEALALMELVASIDDQLIEHLFSIPSNGQRQVHLTTLQRHLDHFLSLVVPYFPDDLRAVQSALNFVMRHKLINSEAIAVQQHPMSSGRYPSLEAKLREWNTWRMQIAEKTLTGPGREGMQAHKQLLASFQAQKERLEAELTGQIPNINLVQKRRAVNRKAVAKALPARSVLVEFVRFNLFDFKAVPARGEPQWKAARYLAFVMPAGEPDNVQLIDLGEAVPIERLIATFKGSITGESKSTDARHGRAFEPISSQETNSSNGTTLRAALFDPLRAAIGNRRHLVLAPDGELIRFSFATLPTDDGRYLIDDYHFSYLQSGRDALRFAAESTKQASEPLVIADPAYDLQDENISTGKERAAPLDDRDWNTLHFSRLAGTHIEGEQVATMLGVKPWLGEKALEAALKAFRSPRILHFATHGFFLPDQKGDPNDEPLSYGLGRLLRARLENPLLRSGLALAGANSWLKGKSLPAEAEDGILTAQDIRNLDLSSTRLVVLSACETGLSKVRTSQSIVSLQRAFQVAGAKKLVMNIWKVPDQQTQQLMADFYRRVLDGQPHAQALREAQLAIKARAPDPYYWGAFICIGDLAPLPAPATTFVEAASPYVVGRPVTGELFVGRRGILKRIQDNLAPSAGQNILVLRGSRRTGKSSVLYRLRETMTKESQGAYLPVVVDMQGMMRIQNENEFFFRLAHQIARGLKRHGMKVGRPNKSDFAEAPSSVFEFDFLEPVTDALGERRILLMLDEFDKLKELIERGRVSADVLDFLRYLMQHTPLLFLIAGTHKLRELTGGYWSVFFNLAVHIDVSVLSERDARWLITAPVNHWYTYESAAINEIVQVTGCHPYFTQLLCHELVTVRNRYRVTHVRKSYVNEAVNGALQSADENIGYAWTEADCSGDERLVLALLALKAPVPVSTIRQHFKEAGLTVAIGAAIKRLLERDVVKQDEKGLTFVVPLLQKWIVQKHYDTLAAARQYNQEHQTSTTYGGSPNV